MYIVIVSNSQWQEDGIKIVCGPFDSRKDAEDLIMDSYSEEFSEILELNKLVDERGYL